MRREWFSAEEIVAAGSPELSSSISSFNRFAAAHLRRVAGKARKRTGARGAPPWEYHISLLPHAAQMRLTLTNGAVAVTGKASAKSRRIEAAWKAYQKATAKAKAKAERALDAIQLVARLEAAGLNVDVAVRKAAAELRVSPASIYRWRDLVKGVAAQHHLPLLLPGYKPTSKFTECHPEAWEVLVSDWLRPERPSFAACYRRMKNTAEANGWEPIPLVSALRRRRKRQIDPAVAELARGGKDKAKRLYPAQRRTRAMLDAMEAVNMDGHRLDVFVALPDTKKPVRMHLIVLQDLYSGKVVGWRLAESENRVAVRLTIGDMVENFGIPDRIVLDNGRAFASKWISGGTPNRYRFKVRDEDPRGLLTSLGVEVHWTKPYSGQSKPIERAFRDLAEEIAKHPFCAGAYVGNTPLAKPENYGSRAVPVEDFRAHVARMVAEHNARPGRDTETAKGRSFDETFGESFARAIVRWPTRAQKSLWLLAAERVSAQRGSGEIHLFGNRYWAPAMNGHAGRKVTVRFDPDHLHRPIGVYAADDRLICEAECIADSGFFDAEAAQEHGRNRAAWERAQREQLRLHRKLSADELAALYGSTPSPAAPAAAHPKVKRLAVGGPAGAAGLQVEDAPGTMDEENFEESFSRGLRLIAGERSGEL